MKFKLFKKTEEPPTQLLNPNKYSERGRFLVPVAAVPHEGGWAVETEDPEAAVCALKDYNFLLLEPEEHQFPIVPNFDGDVLAAKFKFKAATPEEIAAGKYLTYPEQKKAERLAEEAAAKEAERLAEEAAPEVPVDETEAPATVDAATEPEEVESPDLVADGEAKALRAKLKEAGKTFGPRTSIEKLRAMVAELPASEG